MASYFDLQPQTKKTATGIDAPSDGQQWGMGKSSLLSPAVTQLLDGLGDEKSDSSSEEHSPSDDDTTAKTKSVNGPTQLSKEQKCPQAPAVPSTLSPRRQSVKSNKKPVHPAVSSKQKHPHIARFHSLRSMLFSANLEDKMHEDARREEEAANKWKAQHEQRQMHRPKTPENRPKTPEQEKDGLRSRIKTSIRRVTTKDVPTMGRIQEGKVSDFDDHGSTASSDEEEQQPTQWRPREDDEESIHHSDVEDLVRWVSRRDPPSDGEARKLSVIEQKKEDSGHESLGHSDVEDLARYASRRSVMTRDTTTGYSDASTETDDDHISKSTASEEAEDAADLSRWISHRDGPKAGPIRRNLEREELDTDIEQHYDSDVPELGRWVKRHDETSGESRGNTPDRGHRETLAVEEPERGRSRSRSESSSRQQTQKTHLTHDDINDLVRWVSRKGSNPEDAARMAQDAAATSIPENEIAKKETLGMSEEKRGSLSHDDIMDLVQHVQSRNVNTPPEPALNTLIVPEIVDTRHSSIDATQASTSAKKANLGMTLDEGSLSHSDVKDLLEHVKSNVSHTEPDSVETIENVDIDSQEQKKQALGMTIDEGSLSHSDVKEIIAHVKAKEDDGLQGGAQMQAPPLGDSVRSRDTPTKADLGAEEARSRAGSLSHDDVDELVRWVSRK